MDVAICQDRWQGYVGYDELDGSCEVEDFPNRSTQKHYKEGDKSSGRTKFDIPSFVG